MNTWKRVLICFCLFSGLYITANSQNKISKLDSLKEKLAYLQSIDSNHAEIVDLLYLLENETRITDPNQCIKYGELAIKIAEFRKDKNALSGHYNVVGNIYFSQKQYYIAMQYFFKGYRTMVESGREDSTGFYLIDIGNCFFADNNFELPIRFYRKAANVFIKNKIDYGTAVAFNNIGLVKNKIGEQDSALYYFNLALTYRKKLNEPFLLAHSYRYIGDTYQKKKDHKKALDYLNKALTIILKIEKKTYDERYLYGDVYISIAQVYESQQKYELAIENYKLSLQAFIGSLNNKFKLTSILQNLSTCYLLSKQYEQALLYAEKALKLAEEIKSLDEERNCHYILVQIYAKTTNAQKVFTHLEKYSQITDSLLADQSEEKFSKLRIEVESYQIDKELAYQNAVNANVVTKMQHRVIIRNMLLLGSILLILLVIALLIAYKRKLKINRILFEKNAQISKQKEELEITARFKQEFLANMSHEIRTPMTGIIGMIDFLEKTKLDEKQNEYLEIIKNSSDVLLIIINDILDLSKIEAGKMELRPVVFSANSLIRKTQLLFTSLLDKKDILIKFEFLSDLPDYMEADEMRLMEIITNLISNAVKYTEKGTITVNLGLDKIEGDKMKVKMEVIDTGIGIDIEDQAQLFNIFTQLDAFPVLKHKGSGLGLSISKKLTELMGGEIGVESDGKNGSKFWFTFDAVVVYKNQQNENNETKNNELSRSLNISVLLVEDKLVNQKVLELMLNYYGCKTTIASNGLEALEKVDKNKFDIIFMDIQMPVMDGFTAVKELRRLYQNLPPIVALSANVLEGYHEKFISEGMDDCIAKPVKSEDLVKIIIKWCPLVIKNKN